MRTRWLPSAIRDLEGIYEYVKANHPRFATSTMRQLYEAIRSLNQIPFRGRVSAEPGVRMMAMPRVPYIVYYRINEPWIEVLYIRHGAQDRPFQH